MRPGLQDSRGIRYPFGASLEGSSAPAQGSAGSTILPLGPAHSGVGNHVAALALHPSSEKLTVPTQVKAPSPLLIKGQEAHAVFPLEYRCAL